MEQYRAILCGLLDLQKPGDGACKKAISIYKLVNLTPQELPVDRAQYDYPISAEAVQSQHGQ